MKKYIVILATSTYLLLGGGFDDTLSNIGEKVKIRHMAKTHKNGVVGNTLYLYRANKKVKIKDESGVLNINTVRTNEKTLRKNRKLNVTLIQENTRINMVSKGMNHRHRTSSRYQQNKNNGVNINSVDIRGTKIRNVKIYDRNNRYTIRK